MPAANNFAMPPALRAGLKTGIGLRESRRKFAAGEVGVGVSFGSILSGITLPVMAGRTHSEFSTRPWQSHPPLCNTLGGWEPISDFTVVSNREIIGSPQLCRFGFCAVRLFAEIQHGDLRPFGHPLFDQRRNDHVVEPRLDRWRDWLSIGSHGQGRFLWFG